LTPQPAPSAPPIPARVPASTIRAIRRFHALDQAGLAHAFQVSVRTVIRWEQKGVDPDNLPLGEGARDPKWRKKLLFWMLRRYELTASPDNRKEGADERP
jgi:hypothetical protein